MGLVGPTHAQFGTQLVLDSATTSAYALSGTTANNGDAVFLCKGHNGFSSIRRHAPDGTPIWSKDYATSGVNAQLNLLQADPNGGFLVARQRSSSIVNGGSLGPDTTVLEMDLASIGENGEVNWVRTLKRERIAYFQYPSNLHWVNVIRLSNNDIAVFAGVQLSGAYGFLWMLRLTPDGGQVLQARQFGHSAAASPELPLAHTGNSLLEFDNGDLLFVAPMGTGPAAFPVVVRFDASGDWIWAKTIDYSNNSPGQGTHQAVFSSNGDILVHHEVNAPAGRTLIDRLDSDGSWIRSDLYSDLQWLGFQARFVPISGGGYAIVKDNGRILLVNEDASPATLYNHPSNTFGDMTYSGNFKNAAIQGNELHLYGSFGGVNQVFGNTTSWPFFERFDLSGPLEGCNVEDIGMEQFAVPANLVQVADLNPPPTLDISSTITLTDAVWTTTDLTGLSPLSLCLLIEQLGVGVEEIDGANTTPLLRSNARPAGSMVEVMVPAPGNLQLHDSFGRLVAEKRVHVDGPAQLSAPPVAGQYVLSWTANDGSGRRSERMMVH